ncbi:putative exocyst complex component sec8 [Ceratocystis platani]|uniref:Exocyst complex component Sec8 n=1 Tax=Ceratocystis fimbriata f. sp. platani TaxID=88771 RepID=A0A0F8DCB1_CERFI|nr:putative exocyst complex component sec8 [Ceratocystis platani]
MSADRRYAPPNGRPTQRTNGYGNFGPAPNLQQQQQQQPQRDPNPLPNDYDAYGDGYGGSNGNGAPPPRGRPMGERPALRPSPSSNMTSMSNDGGVDMRAGNMGYRNGSVGGGSESSGTAISMRSARERFDSPGRVSLGNRSRSPQPGSQAPASQAAPPPSQPTMRSMPSRNRLNERLNARDASPSQPSLHHQSSRLLQQHQQQQQQQQQYQYQQDSAAVEQRRAPESNAEREIIQVLEHIRKEWPALCTSDCVPVQLALQLLDNSSVGRAHEYRNFQHTYMMLQNSLKGVVHEHHQGFNSSIGTFHQIQNSIQESQMKVAGLKETLLATKTSLCNPDSELKKLSVTSQMYDGLIVVLDELEDLRLVPDQLEARISEKRFLTAVEVLQTALRKLRKPELDDIGALGELRSYLANQETALMDILVEELHEHLYLKSPYCQERWQSIAKNHGTEAFANGGSNPPPFEQLLDNMDFEKAATEDLAKNPEADTFEYVGLLVEALNKLGRLQNAVDNLKQRLPVELFQIANETINEVDQRHPSSLRGGSGGSGSGSSGGSGGNDGGSGNGSGIGGGSSGSNGLGIYGSRETQLRADVIYDLLWTLYGKFEAIAEGHRVFHESIKALIRREGAGNNSALLGSFKELWNLYQNEIRTLLNYYVTSHADVYQFSTSPNPGAGSGKVDGIRDHLFRFSDTDAKGIELATEMEALDLIIQAAVPGLTGREKDEKKSALGLRSAQKSTGLGFGDRHGTGTYKSLVDPSVFNMSLLLPPTLVFLQRLKGIVPPGSDLATSTLTSFLDNFLVNVFQPQLDETLAKLTDTVFNEPDSFQQDQNWSMVAKKPIFKGTSSFFTIVTAFCRMLGTIPHDQALSSLLVSQMMRYYDCVFTWFKGLVTKTAQAQDSSNAPLPDDDIRNLRICARFALSESEINDVMHSRWTGDLNDPVLLEKETYLLVAHVAKQGLELSDIIQDKDTISSLCLIYTSMKWLAIKSQGLRHITHQETDTSQNSLPRATSQRWSLMHDKTPDEGGPVYLPLTQDTVQTFDRIVKSYQELASTALRTLHMEIRCQIMHSLNMVLSPTTTPYILDQDILEPDAQILKLNNNLVSYDEAVSRFLHTREAQYIRSGLGRLISNIIVTNASIASPMNMQGCGRMQLNILVLQQNLKNIEDGVDLKRATSYFGMFSQGGDKILEAAHNMKSLPDEAPDKFTHEELKKLLELCYSEQLSDPERGVAAAARRQMDDKMQNLDEIMRQ